MSAPRSPRARGGRIRVGIGSWTDPEYTGLLFPEGTRPEERLAIYATHFDHVELNSTFYRTPAPSVVRNWVKQTSPGFTFNFKLHQAFSRNPAKAAGEGPLVQALLACTQPLIESGKLGAFFLVMPPSFGPAQHTLEELDALIERLQPHRLAVELRNRDWVTDEQRAQTLAFFHTRQLVWIAVDLPRIAGSTLMPPIDEVTNPRLAYLRLHGRNKLWLTLKSAAEKHTYQYSAAELKAIARRVRALSEKAQQVHVVANNHARDFAPRTALALQRLLGLRPGARPATRRRGASRS